jgi:hypothetical protein
LSPRLDVVPSFEPERHVKRVDLTGPDALVLPPDDDWRALAARLDALGVTYTLEREPVVVFYDLSRRVRLEEVADFRSTPATTPDPAGE